MQITKYIQSISAELTAHESELNNLDAAIGDGDHGSNVVRGFKAILDQSSQFTNDSLIEKDLMLCAQQLMAKIGGSSGPLLGSAFMALAVSLKGKTTFTNQDIALGLQAAFDRISQLGKSRVGEKTMLDALAPSIEAMKNTTGSLNFSNAYQAAKKGAESTISLLATKGRASYLGERSIGHMDPGACSMSLIFEALTKVETTKNVPVDNITKVNAPQNTIQSKTDLKSISQNVSILVVSHSEPLAKATVDFANEMKNGDFSFRYVAGIENGKVFGTDPQIIKKAIETLSLNSEVLLIYDLGSSKMNSELAISLLSSEMQHRVQIAHCAFVEGTIVAVSSNNTQSAIELKNIVESQMKVIK
ncbi:MAG: dihydroxyacetone kinase subunit L [Mycoplasmataceae bacterium]|jgi:dihydroxyacetone kinase-like protein|nr:dihydroxyacetone kinase subunit L [Mycoplasmataceae bacterium]